LAMGSLIVLVVLALPDGLAGLLDRRGGSDSANKDLE